jgi:hypothetical protein
MIVEIDTITDEGLSHNVIRRIVEILGGEGSGSNSGEAMVSRLDDAAFDQSLWHPSLPPEDRPLFL